MLEVALLAAFSGVVPGAAGGRCRSFEVEPAPVRFLGGKLDLGFVQGDNFAGTHACVVDAAEEGFQVLPRWPLFGDGIEERLGLGGVDDAAPVDGLGDLG